MKSHVTNGLATLLAAGALAISLAGPTAAPAAAQTQSLPDGPVLKSDLPDLIPTTIGYIVVSGPVQWGQTGELGPSQVESTLVGRNRDLCRFRPFGYRTFNKGGGNAGAFVVKTFVNNTLAHTHNVPGGLKSKRFIDWHQYGLDLKEGMNVIKVVFDANKQVAEADESNSYIVKVNVKADCNNDGKIGGVAIPGNPKLTPGKTSPDPRPSGILRVKPAQ